MAVTSDRISPKFGSRAISGRAYPHPNKATFLLVQIWSSSCFKVFETPSLVSNLEGLPWHGSG